MNASGSAVLKRQKGFSLIEIVIIVQIIAILLVIAVPSFIRSRKAGRLQVIVGNLVAIDKAKHLCSMERGASNGDTTTCTSAVMTHATTGWLKKWPTGPVAGTYDAGAIGARPTFMSKDEFQWRTDFSGL